MEGDENQAGDGKEMVKSHKRSPEILIDLSGVWGHDSGHSQQYETGEACETGPTGKQSRGRGFCNDNSGDDQEKSDHTKKEVTVP